MSVIILYTSVLIGSVCIYIFLSDILCKRKGSDSSTSPSQLFNVAELVSSHRRILICFLFASPWAITFAYLSFTSPDTVKAAKGIILNLIEKLYESGEAVAASNPSREADSGSIAKFITEIPPEFDPVFILVASLCLFLPYVRSPIVAGADLVIRVASIRERADRLSLRLARSLLTLAPVLDQARRDGVSALDIAEKRINSAFAIDTPLPVELVNAGADVKLAYKILYIGKDTYYGIPLTNTAEKISEKLGLVSEFRNSRSEDVFAFKAIVSATTLMFILCTLYVFLIPHAAGIVNVWPNLLQPIDWPEPDPEKYKRLSVSVCQRICSFVFPFSWGLYMISSRRRAKFNQEALGKSVAFVCAVAFIASFVLNSVFSFVLVLQFSIGADGLSAAVGRAKDAMSQLAVASEIFFYSLIAPALILVSTFLTGLNSKIFVVTLGFLAGSLFFAAQVVVEMSSKDYSRSGFVGYYWHQLSLGFFLSVFYFLSSYLLEDETLEGPVLVDADIRQADLQTVGDLRAFPSSS